ncbi:DNA-dependent RNA polymerase subunit epsilon [Bacillus sp. FJAT-45037]|uniref:DNA-dependent RNA polymerase subunit epsilon n=1 Tax=Bacillus sp. FJAT-45037 TaxID=2011007 RepID=UPI000C238988|nr:DNA-directed RNA polymerase subunit epsilon [Bacillus sp. FJAT-45037]
MIFKVYFQETLMQVPVRERTQTIYVEGESESDVRKKLIPRDYNIEFITPVSGAYLDYEKQHEDFNVESI